MFDEETRPDVKRKTFLLLAITIAVMFLAWLLVWFFTDPITTGEGDQKRVIWSWSASFVWAALFYIIFSFRFFNPVKTEEIGVRTILQVPFDETGPGPIFAPLLVVNVRHFNINERQKEYPAEPELIYRPAEGDSTAAPGKMRPPLRIPFGNSVNEEQAKRLLGYDDDGGDETTLESDRLYYCWRERDPKTNEKVRDYKFDIGITSDNDGLTTRVTAEVSFIVRWRIVKGKGTQFVRRIGSEELFEKQIEDLASALLQELLPKMSVAQALENLTMINAILVYKVRKATSDWGVDIPDTTIKQIIFHRALNSAIGEKAEAPFAGEAERITITKKGEGDAAAAAAFERETLAARASGYQSIASSIGVPGAAVQAAEVARVIGSSESTVVVGDSGWGSLYGLGAQILKGGDSNTAKKEPSEDKKPAETKSGESDE